MKKRVIKEFKRDLNQGFKGLQISLLIIILIASILSSQMILNKGLSDTTNLILRLPQNNLDFLALFAGILIFIAIPFTLSIQIKKIKES